MKWIRAMELRRELATSKRQGMMTNRFAELAVEVARRYYMTERWSGTDADTLMSDFHLRLARNWQKIEEINPRSYLQKMAYFVGLDLLRRDCRRYGRMHELVELAEEHGYRARRI